MTPRGIASALSISKQAVVKRIAGLQIAPARKLVGRGGVIFDYDLAQLPADWRERLSNRSELPKDPAPTNPTPPIAGPVPENQGGGRPPSPAALVPLFADLMLPPEREAELAALASGEQHLAVERFQAIEPILNGRRDWARSIGTLARFSKAQAVAAIAARQRVSAGTIWRWRALFLRRGMAGLIQQPRSDKGVSRILSAPDRIDLASIYLKEGSARGAWREFCRQKGRRLTYGAVKRFLRTLPRPVVSRALEGAKAFNDAHAPYIARTYEKLQPNDIWVMDHSQHDLFVNAWGKAARPWLTAIMDMKARFIVGWCLSLQPDSLTIASALRMALLAGGIPQAVYLDNGKDFRSRYLGGVGQRLGAIDFADESRGVLAELDVKAIYATPFHPQAKSIERFFGTLRRQFDSGFNSYCGHRPGRRPDTCQLLIEEHKDAVEAGSADASPLPRLEALAFAFAAWLENEYHQQTHRGRGMSSRTPADVYQASDRQVESWKLDLLLMKREQRRVIRCGVELFGHRYEQPENGLLLHNDHLAEVLFDPWGRSIPDLTQVVVVCCRQRFLCRSLAEPETYEELQQRLRSRRQLNRAVEQYIAEIHRRASLPAPGERRLAAAQGALPAGIDPRAPARALAPAYEPTPEEEAAAALAGDDSVVLPDYGAMGDKVLDERKRRE